MDHARRPPVAATAIVLLTVAALWLTTVAPPADAHASLQSSDPAGGSIVEQPPTQVTLTFNENVEPDFNQIQVTDPAGNRADAGLPTIDASTAVVPLQPGGPTGGYTVAYRVISADGHPVEATFTFDVVAPAAAPAPTIEPDPTAAPAPEAVEEGTSTEETVSDLPSEARAEQPGPEETVSEVEAVPTTSNTPRGNDIALLLGGAVLVAAVAGGVYLVFRRRTGTASTT